MVSSRGSADMIAAIYDAGLDPTRWDEVIGKIAGRTNSVSGSLAIRRADTIELAALHNMDPSYAEAYAKNWYKRNPLDTFKDSIAPGELRTYTEITQTDRFKASAYFNEFCRPQGWSDGLVACLGRGHSSSGFFGLVRSPERIWVEPADWRLLETLVPHLQRAVEVNRLLLRSTAITDSLGRAFEAAGFGILLVTEDCRILFANTKAEDFLRRRVGLQSSLGRLTARDRRIHERLQALVRRRSKSAQSGCDGGTLELCREGEDRPLVAHVIPLSPVCTLAIIDLERPAAAVFLVDPTADLFARVRRFASRFGLTGAETRVLAEIISGSRIPAAAEKLKVTEGTLRTHAKRILSKTGSTRQAELVRRFFETSLPEAPSGW
jgi:DNA-binding CsgD family transcriptional regulator